MMTLMMCLMGMSYGQDTITYNEINTAIVKPKKVNTYISKIGEVFSIGDKIELGYPSNGIFVHISVFDYTGNVYPPLKASDGNSKVEIKKIRISGNKKMVLKYLWRQLLLQV